MAEQTSSSQRALELSAHEVAWLGKRSGLQYSDNSPLASFATVEPTADEQSLAERRALEPMAEAALELLSDPDVQVRSIIAGASETNVSVFLGRRRQHPDVLVGFSETDSGVRLTFPWRRQDLIAVASQLIGSAPEAVDPLDLKLSPNGLAAFAAVIDVMRERLFRSLLDRDSELSLSIANEELLTQAQAGSQSSDGRWVFSALRMLSPTAVPLPGEGIEEGTTELLECGLLTDANAQWFVSPQVKRLAAQLWSALPALAHELIVFSGDDPEIICHQTILHGAGPLRTFEYEDIIPGEPTVMVSSNNPPAVLEQLEAHLTPPSLAPEPDALAAAPPPAQPATAPAARDRFCYADGAVDVRDIEDHTKVIARLEPRRAYLVRREAGDWVHIADPPSGLEGWVAKVEIHLADG